MTETLYRDALDFVQIFVYVIRYLFANLLLAFVSFCFGRELVSKLSTKCVLVNSGTHFYLARFTFLFW